MRNTLNLGSHPFVNRTPHVLLLSTLFVVGAGLSAWNVSLYLGTRTEARSVEHELRQIADQEAAMGLRRTDLLRRLQAVDLDSLATRVDAANQVLTEKALSWTLLLARLKEVMPYDAALMSVHATVNSNRISLALSVRARNEEYYLLMLEQLEKSECFSQVYPANDKSSDSGELEAAIELDYDPACGLGPPPTPKRAGKSAGSARAKAKKKTPPQGGARRG